MTAPFPPPTVMHHAHQIGAHLEAMIAVQMAAYPSDWSDDDKLEMAVAHLFGRLSETDQ